MTGFTRIDPERASALLDDPETQLVDIRDPDSFRQGHIPGSRHLDNNGLHDFIMNADLDQPLIVTCYHGHASQSAAAYLANQGFEQVFSLDGGFEGWSARYPERIER